VIQVNAGLQLIGLTTPPAGTATHDLVVDTHGRDYIQP